MHHTLRFWSAPTSQGSYWGSRQAGPAAPAPPAALTAGAESNTQLSTALWPGPEAWCQDAQHPLLRLHQERPQFQLSSYTEGTAKPDTCKNRNTEVLLKKKPTILTEVPIAEAWTVSPAFYTNSFLFWTCKWAVSTDSLQYHLKVKSVLGTHRCMSKAIFIFDIYPVRPSLKYS